HRRNCVAQFARCTARRHALPRPLAARQSDAARTPPADRPPAPTPRATGIPRLPNLGRCEVRIAAPVRPRDRAARPLADLAAPDQARTDHANRGGAAGMAGTLCAFAEANGGIIGVFLSRARSEALRAE